MGCGVSVVEWDGGLCSPLLDVGLFEASIDGEGGGREVVEFVLCGRVIYKVLAASCWFVCSGAARRAV